MELGQGFRGVLQGELWGIQDAAGGWILPPRYARLEGTATELMAYDRQGNWWALDVVHRKTLRHSVQERWRPPEGCATSAEVLAQLTEMASRDESCVREILAQGKRVARVRLEDKMKFQLCTVGFEEGEEELFYYYG